MSSYQVDTIALDKVALFVFKDLSKNCNILIIDEIGKMELFSKKFENEIKKLFNNKQNFLIVVIVSIATDVPLVEKLKNMQNTEVLELNKSNRNLIYKKIYNKITKYSNNI